jgi:isopentenyl phosphate kinase
VATTGELVFLKLGGSLITDKARPRTARLDVLRRLAGEIRAALEARPGLQLLLGHGSGSFGHPPAARYRTREGVRSLEEWQGLARVAAAAARLNRIVTDTLLDGGIPVLSLQPSASVRCHDGLVTVLEIHPIRLALRHGLVPLIYGDVAPDDVRGGTIASTEDLFLYLAAELHPSRILLAGATPGVLDAQGAVVPLITPPTLPDTRAFVKGARETDVTGGMADKVTRMVSLVQAQAGLVVEILSGLEPGTIRQALERPDFAAGTRLTAAP